MLTDKESDDFHARTASFMQWMQQLPETRVSSKIQVADLRDQRAGRGIIATADIEEDEELFSIAHSHVLTAQNSSLQQLKPALLERLDAWNALVLCMIHEDGQGKDSKWYPYLQILPKDFDTLIYWSPSELAELDGSAVLDKVGKDEAGASFTKILLPIVQQDPDLFGIYAGDFSGGNSQSILLELAHRMATLIMAYGFDLETENSSSDEEEEVDGSSQLAYELNKGMVPLADLFNADGESNNAYLLQNEDSMTMIALKNIASGQQIFNDFGQLPRSDLLRRYGYVTDNYKKWDVVEVSIDILTQAAIKYTELESREKELRLELAATWGALQDGYDLHRPAENGILDFDQDMVLTITALLLNPEDFEQALEERPECPPPSIIPTLNLVLREIVTSRQKAYKTTIAEDIDLVKDSTLPSRSKMAIEVRLGEKEILSLAAQRLNQQPPNYGSRAEDQSKMDHFKRQKMG